MLLINNPVQQYGAAAGEGPTLSSYQDVVSNACSRSVPKSRSPPPSTSAVAHVHPNSTHARYRPSLSLYVALVYEPNSPYRERRTRVFALNLALQFWQAITNTTSGQRARVPTN